MPKRPWLPLPRPSHRNFFCRLKNSAAVFLRGRRSLLQRCRQRSALERVAMSTASPRQYRVFDPGLYHEVTQRIRNGKFLLDPNCPLLKAAIFGVLADSMKRYSVKVLALHFMTDHFHALYSIDCPYKFAKFLAYFHAGITRAYNRLQAAADPQHDYEPVSLWHEMKWMPVATDEKTLTWRLAYIMGQAVAANLVDHPVQFPGASTIDAMIDGTPIKGKTYDATARYRDSRLQGGPQTEDHYEHDRELVVTPPSCWSHLPPEQLRQRYIEVADSVARVPLAELRRAKVEVPVGPTRGHAEPAVGPGGEPDSSEIGEPGLCQAVAAPGDFPAAPSEKVHIPQRSDDARQPFEAGAPRAKKSYYTADGKRKKRPLILASSATVCQAYEAAYAEWVAQYLQAKSDCRAAMEVRPSGLRAPGLAIPRYMLLGSMPYPRTE